MDLPKVNNLNVLVLCLYGRAGFEAISHILLRNNFNYTRIIVFSHEMNNEPLITFIKTLGIEFYLDSINNHVDKLVGLNGFLLSIHYRYIISSEILSKFIGPKVNLHPSLLPHYRGCFSSAWAIINDEKKTGITYHIISEKVDRGNILLQESIDISANESAYSLFHKLISLGISKLDKVFELISLGSLGTPQESGGSYYSRNVPYNGLIDLSWSDEFKERFSRALIFPPFPPAKLG